MAEFDDQGRSVAMGAMAYQIDVAQVRGFSSWSLMLRSMLLVGVGKSPRMPRETIFCHQSVLVVYSWIPMAFRNFPNVRKTRRPTFSGARAPMSSKYPISGVQMMLSQRTSNRRGEQL